MTKKTKKTKKTITPKSLTKEKIKQIISIIDFQYSGIEYDYDTLHDCISNGCCDEGICRCGKIVDFKITSIDRLYIANKVMRDLKNKLKCTFIDCYCIERVIASTKLTEDDFYVDIQHSYYGEEVFGITLESINPNLINCLHALFQSKSFYDKIKIALEYEYEYLTPEIKEKKAATIVKVDIDDIKVGNNEYLRKVDTETLDIYKEYADGTDSIIGVCLSVGPNEYRIVDGYHRYAAKKKFYPKSTKTTIVLLK